MLKVGSRPAGFPAPRRPRHRIIIASGDNVRTIAVRPWLVGSLAVLATAFFTLYFGATGYLVFRDDLLAASIVRQARIQHAYEDRIALLRADIDRLTSRQLLNQQAFEDRLEKLLGRQAALDARQDIIAGLSQATRRAGLGESTAPLAVPETTKAPETTEPLTTGSIAPLQAGQRAPLALAKLRSSNDPDRPAPADVRLADVENSLERLAEEQVTFVEDIAGEVGQRADKIATALKKIGHAPAEKESDIGGPFVPLAPNADTETFRNNVEVITAELDRFARVRDIAAKLPLAKPVPKSAITSRFGSRMDPFLRRPALHTGIDFRAKAGYPVRATADGVVTMAEYNGGYGNLVEVDHGNGVSTRYAHMSRISVKKGQKIAKGAIVGKAGSTGRSTGPHVHYEIRVGDNPIDPIRYIRVGSEIAPLL